MELIQAQIINFGKLSNQTLDFKKGLNSFIHENGWGKTTLSVFIKSMLYGMEHTTSKDIEKNEKLKYFPWQGGIYGGSLSFSHNSRKYLVSRTFGLKKNEDTFELRDLQTNKICGDFTSDLGNELFGISRETYGRSVHVVLSESPAGSTDISARLNNLVEADDVSSFDKAVAALEKEASAIKAKRNKIGELYDIQKQIDADREALGEIKSRSLQTEEYERKIKEIGAEIGALRGEQERATHELSLNAKYEAKIRYEQLKKDFEDAVNARAAVLDFFNGKIPDPQTLKAIDEISSEYSTVEANLKSGRLSQSEKDQYESLKNYFAGDIPTKEQIEACLKADGDYKRFVQLDGEKRLSEQELSDFVELKKIFAGLGLEKSTINKFVEDYSLVQAQKNQMVRLEAEKATLQNQMKEKSGAGAKNILLAALALIFAGVLAAGLAVKIPLLSLAGGTLIFALLLVFVLGQKGASRGERQRKEEELLRLENQIEELRRDSAQKEGAYRNFISSAGQNPEKEIASLNQLGIDFDRYSKLLQKSDAHYAWLQGQKKLAAEYEAELLAFVKRFCKSQDISSVPTEIQILNEKLGLLWELEKKVNSEASNNQLQSEKKEKLLQILSQYKTEKTRDFSQQVLELHAKINDLKNADSLVAGAEQKLSDFEKNPQNDVEGFEGLDKPEKNLDELKAALEEANSRLNQKTELCADYQKRVRDNYALIERKDDVENEIEELTRQKAEKTARHELLLKTLDFLTKAKEKLDANYSDPMKKGFEKYVALIDKNLEGTGDDGGKNPARLIIDTDLKVSVDKNGRLYESEYLSDGYKDMVNFCSRMALVDALFKDVKPPVILDDPFVNLDDDKLLQALKLVEELAGEKQVLYFACHQSRKL